MPLLLQRSVLCQLFRFSSIWNVFGIDWLGFGCCFGRHHIINFHPKFASMVFSTPDSLRLTSQSFGFASLQFCCEIQWSLLLQCFLTFWCAYEIEIAGKKCFFSNQ